MVANFSNRPNNDDDVDKAEREREKIMLFALNAATLLTTHQELLLLFGVK